MTTIIEMFTKEFNQEAETTRKMLSIVPNDKYDWQPHPKSMTVKRLATHIADLPNWIEMALNTDELDFQTSAWKEPNVTSNAELMKFFERSVKNGRGALEVANEAVLDKEWVLRSGDAIFD